MARKRKTTALEEVRNRLESFKSGIQLSPRIRPPGPTPGQQKIVHTAGRFARGVAQGVTDGAQTLGRGVGTAITAPVNLLYQNKNAQIDRRLQTTLNARAKRQLQAGNIAASRHTANLSADVGQRGRQRLQTFGNSLGQARKDVVSGGVRTGLTLAGAGSSALRPAAALGGALGGIQAKFQGQDVVSGVGRGIGGSVKFAGINRVTAPVINPVAERLGQAGGIVAGAAFRGKDARNLQLASSIGRLIGRATTQGGSNVLEDTAYARLAENRSLTRGERQASFALGFGAESLMGLKKALEDGTAKVGVDGYVRNKAGRLFNPVNGQWVKATKKVKQAQEKLLLAAGGEPMLGGQLVPRPNGNGFIRVPMQKAGFVQLGNKPTSNELNAKPTALNGTAGQATLNKGIRKITLQGQEPNPQGTAATHYTNGLPKSNQAIAETQSQKALTSIIPDDTQRYIRAQVKLQKQASKGDSSLAKLRNLGSEIKTKVVDFAAPLEDVLTKAEKRSKFKVLPTNDVRYQIDKALRSDSLATQFIKDRGLAKTIQDVPDLDAFNQYLIAKHATRVVKKGITTGRNLSKDAQLIKDLSGTYEPYAQEIRKFSDALLEYKVQAGFISPDLAQALKKEYPDYVPLNRVFSALEEEAGFKGVGGGVASVGTQRVLQRLKGSEREIRNPLESLMEATAVAFKQGERNRAAQMVASYIDLPGNPFNLRRLKPEEVIGSKSIISTFINGEKITFETTPEIARAAKNLGAEQLGLLGKIFSIPTRILQTGAVSLNLPFVATNFVRDQVTASVISSKVLRTSLANPVNFTRAVFETIGKGKVFEDWVRSGGASTSYDIARESLPATVKSVRAGKNAGSQIKFVATNPSQLLRAIENAVGTTEQLTRIQQFWGTRSALLKEGRIPADADILAAAASRENTANFARRGEWGRVLNGAVPFFNAGIQGARSLVRSAQRDPLGTAVRFSATVGIPTVMVTSWNLADPERKRAYDDIQEYEKENNLVIIPPNPTKDENGKWNAIKIPVTPGLSNLMSVLRRSVEGTNGVANVAGDLLVATTSLDLTNGRKILSQVTPQAIKPAIEAATNTNLFTGIPIVPTFMKSLPPEEQVREDTSGTARLLGKVTKASPLVVENTLRTVGAGLGQQLLHASDSILNKAGVIPEEQIGGESLVENFEKRFRKAAGGKSDDFLYEANLSPKQIETAKGLLAKDPEEAKKYIEEVKQNRQFEKDIEEGKPITVKNPTPNQLKKIKQLSIDKHLQGDMAGAKELSGRYGFQITVKEVEKEQKKYKSKAIEAFLDGDMDEVNELKSKYGDSVRATSKEVSDAARKRAIKLFREGKEDEARALREKYGFAPVKMSEIYK